MVRFEVCLKSLRPPLHSPVWAFRNWKLLEESIRTMMLRLRSHTSGAGFAIVLDETPKSGPYIFSTDKFYGLVLT